MMYNPMTRIMQSYQSIFAYHLAPQLVFAMASIGSRHYFLRHRFQDVPQACGGYGG